MEFVLRIAFLSVVFIVLILFRKRITCLIQKVPLPTFVLYVLTSIPLIILEEQVNCEAKWCGTVLIPPTLPFVLAEVLILYVLYRWLKPRRVLALVIAYSIFGIFWEFILGGAKDAVLPGPFMAFMVAWVAISYAFVSMTPLDLLTKKEQTATP